MGQSLFQTRQTPAQRNRANISNDKLNQINEIKKLLSSTPNPQAVAERMMANNPQFAQFMNNCKGKNVREICNSYGLDYDAVEQILH